MIRTSHRAKPRPAAGGFSGVEINRGLAQIGACCRLCANCFPAQPRYPDALPAGIGCTMGAVFPTIEAVMASFDLKDKTAIAGAGSSPFGRKLHRSPIDLAAEAIANALDDAGLGRDQLDGMIVSFGSPLGADVDTIAPLLGLKLRAYSQTWAHGRFTASCI